MEFVLLCDPDNRRTRFFQEALQAHGQPPAAVCPWWRLLEEGPTALGLQPGRGQWLRIDSPEGDGRAATGFLAWGAAAMKAPQERWGEQISAADARALPFDGSGLRFGRQRFLGFAAALRQIDDALAATETRCTHPPEDIALMSHKARCHQRLQQAGVSQPAALPVASTDALLEHIATTGQPAFVKQWHGSSAAGIAAVQRLPGCGKWQLQTSAVIADDGPFSSLQLRTHTAEAQLRKVLDFLYAEGAHTEVWTPKLRIDGREFDLRVVVIAGQTRHVAVRISCHESPMTNLHFGNERGRPEDVIALIGNDGWDEAMALAEAAAACFPESLCVGLDLMFDEAARPLVIEANPFGDLLPRILSETQSTYEAQVTAALAQVTTTA